MRDITTNPEWERAYQYEIPVLAKENSDGKEVCIVLNSIKTRQDSYLIITLWQEVLPRLSPRLSAEIIQKKLLAAFS